MESFEVRTFLAAAAPEVWDHVVTEDGINDELMPLMRMTMPKAFRGRTIADVSPPERLGRSWILLFGVLPFDYDDIGIAELEPGRRFLEQSTMFSMRRWQHERTVSPEDEGCSVRDRIEFELRGPLRRVGWLHRALRAGLRRVFRHRHHRLARRFGAVPGAPSA
jgi:ligand-binding SRPBCC domain-containing protein